MHILFLYVFFKVSVAFAIWDNKAQAWVSRGFGATDESRPMAHTLVLHTNVLVNYLSDRYLRASMAAWQPLPAAEMA